MRERRAEEEAILAEERSKEAKAREVMVSERKKIAMDNAIRAAEYDKIHREARRNLGSHAQLDTRTRPGLRPTSTSWRSAEHTNPTETNHPTHNKPQPTFRTNQPSFTSINKTTFSINPKPPIFETLNIIHVDEDSASGRVSFRWGCFCGGFLATSE